MFGIGVGIRVGGRTPVGGSAYDADAQAFFDRVTTAGGTLTTTEKNATNQLVLDMKSAGIWTSMKAVYPMVGASAAACAQNLKSSSFTGTFTSGWTFASTGVTPNGTSAYMDTGFNGNTNGTLSNEHISFYSRTNIGDKPIMGASDGADETNIYPNLGGTFYYRVQKTNGGSSGTNLNGAAFFMANRVDSSNVSGFRNTTKYTISNAVGNKLNRNYYIGGNNNVVGTAYATNQCAFASIGDGLTDTQASNFYTAVQAFQTTLARNV